MGQFLVTAGAALFAVALVALVKGSRPRFNIGGRKSAAILMAVGLLAAIIGSGMSSTSPPTVPSKNARSPSPATSPAPLSVTLVPSPSPTRVQVSPSPSAPSPLGLPPGVPAGVQKGVVAKNVDGDTIWVEITEPGGPLVAGAVHKIRMLEIDTPESTNRKDCFGNDASSFAKAELPVGSTVYLLADRQDKDRYGRFLRYVWKENGEFYNLKAVQQGYAKAVLYPPNDKYIALLRQAEEDARSVNRGLWLACR